MPLVNDIQERKVKTILTSDINNLELWEGELLDIFNDTTGYTLQLNQVSLNYMPGYHARIYIDASAMPMDLDITDFESNSQNDIINLSGKYIIKITRLDHANILEITELYENNI